VKTSVAAAPSGAKHAGGAAPVRCVQRPSMAGVGGEHALALEEGQHGVAARRECQGS